MRRRAIVPLWELRLDIGPPENLWHGFVGEVAETGPGYCYVLECTGLTKTNRRRERAEKQSGSQLSHHNLKRGPKT